MEVTNSARDKYIRALPQILASASLFYVIIFINLSSPRLSFMLHSLKFYLLAIPLHSLDKSWVFLICNALLLLVLGFFPSSRVDGHNYHNTLEAEEHDVLLLESAHHEADFEDFQGDHHLHACIWEEKEDGSGGSSGGDLGITMEEEVEEEEEEVVTEIIICITEGDGDDQENESSGFEYEDEIFQEDEELEEERIYLEKLSAEELNKKFDDFITKMKEELRIDAQHQHLVRCY